MLIRFQQSFQATGKVFSDSLAAATASSTTASPKAQSSSIQSSTPSKLSSKPAATTNESYLQRLDRESVVLRQVIFLTRFSCSLMIFTFRLIALCFHQHLLVYSPFFLETRSCRIANIFWQQRPRFPRRAGFAVVLFVSPATLRACVVCHLHNHFGRTLLAC